VRPRLWFCLVPCACSSLEFRCNLHACCCGVHYYYAAGRSVASALVEFKLGAENSRISEYGGVYSQLATGAYWAYGRAKSTTCICAVASRCQCVYIARSPPTGASRFSCFAGGHPVFDRGHLLRAWCRKVCVERRRFRHALLAGVSCAMPVGGLPEELKKRVFFRFRVNPHDVADNCGATPADFFCPFGSK
jgi:hypothetical protein